MRSFSLCLSLVLFSTVLSAQKRYLVSPDNDVIPIQAGRSASGVMKEWKNRNVSTTNSICPDVWYFGFYPYWQGSSTVSARHRDVLGEWFDAKVTGTIDTIFWDTYGIHPDDSTAFLRVHRSFIGPDYGPGIRPGPYAPPCQNWGYWVNTNDPDQGIAAFPQEATDSTWVSTIRNSAVPSGPPIGEELWGFGGVPVRLGYGWTVQSMAEYGGPISVTAGDKFFISLTVPHGAGPNGGHVDSAAEAPLRIRADSWHSGPGYEDYPSRRWKFYEHGTSYCGSPPVDSMAPGWTVHGGFYSGDSLEVSYYNFMYSMTITENIPPYIYDATNLHNTFSTGPRVVQALVTDCNPVDPGNAGVATAMIRWSLDDVPQGDIPMSYQGADVWEGAIPGMETESEVTYRVIATDIDAAVASGPTFSFRVVPFGTEWYTIDTGYACVPSDISATGTRIDTAGFFSLPDPPFTGAGTSPLDDGTAGPFDMGGNFVLFGDGFRYAWVGVDGAIALSKGPTDTTDVNSNGRSNPDWDLPGGAVWGRRADTANQELMPPMFIAPFWANHILADTGGQYGNILVGNNGDSCRFIVQWDSLGAYDFHGSTPDVTTFRVILDRCTGVVEFQYESVGTTGLDSANLVGMQGDSGSYPGWVYLNRNGYPMETRIHDGYCVRLIPNVCTVAEDGWNIVAVSATPLSGNYGKTSLFPGAASQAFTFSAGYAAADPLGKGKGYWLKSNGAGPMGGSPSTFDHDVAAAVADGWNIIGGPSGFVDVGTIAATGTVVASPFYGYGDGGYFAAAEIRPGRGYWVRVNGAGTLGMNSAAAVPKAPAAVIAAVVAGTDLTGLNRIVITDAAGHTQTLYLGEEGWTGKDPGFYELPPPPPATTFDVRFTSQKMVETYPGRFTDGGTYEYGIAIRAAAYPLTVRWVIPSPPGGNRRLLLSGGDGSGVNGVIEGSGMVTIRGPIVKGLVIRIDADIDIPSEYALGPNYPNPFNPLTRFTVDLPRTTEVVVAVYDLLGRRIATLLDGKQEAGRYPLTWDGRDGNGAAMPTGIYFVRASSGEFNSARKVMLIK